MIYYHTVYIGILCIEKILLQIFNRYCNARLNNVTAWVRVSICMYV